MLGDNNVDNWKSANVKKRLSLFQITLEVSLKADQMKLAETIWDGSNFPHFELPFVSPPRRREIKNFDYAV